MEFGNYPYHSLRHSFCLLNAVLWFGDIFMPILVLGAIETALFTATVNQNGRYCPTSLAINHRYLYLLLRTRLA